MFQPLEGRLSWEQTPDGISVEIPARRGALASCYIPLLGIFVVFAWMHHWYETGKDLTLEDVQSTLQAITVVGIAIGFFFLVSWLAWTFTSQTFLTLDPSQLKIQQRVMGIDLVTRSFPTREIHNLKFIPPASPLGGKTVIDPKTSKLQFQIGKHAHSFGAGVTAPEAFALLQKMLDIYKFPELVDSREIPLPK
jgi:hypothetical protein